MTHDEQAEQALKLLHQFIHQMFGQIVTVWATHDLSLSQIKLLFALARAGPLTIGQIAEYLHIGQSAASHVADRLVQTHLADRADDPADRRRAIVRLSADGEDLIGRRRAPRRRMYEWLQSLDDTHLTVLIETFTMLLDAASRVQGDTFFEEASQE